MTQIFECLRCGRVSTLTAIPVHCRACGGRNGIIRDAEPRDNDELLQSPPGPQPSPGNATG